MNRSLLASSMIAAACLAATEAAAQAPAQSAAQKPAAPQTAAPPAAQPKAAPADGTTVSEVQVTGTRQQVETSIDRRSYSVANDLQARSGSLGDVLRNVPSVQVDVNGNVSLRGDPNVTVLVDGRPSAMFSKETLAQVIQALPADQVERIEIITNPSAEFRADGSAGIINLVMKKAKGVGRTGSLRVGGSNRGGYGATISHGFNDDKLSVADSLSLRRERVTLTGEGLRTYPDPAGGIVTSEDVLAGDSVVELAQGRISADYELDAKTRLNGTLVGFAQDGRQALLDSYVDTNGAGTVTTYDRRSESGFEGHNLQADVNWRRTFGDQHDLNLHGAVSTNRNENDRFDTTQPPAGAAFVQEFIRRNENDRSSVSGDYQRKLADGSQLKAGFLGEVIDTTIRSAAGSGPSRTAITLDPARNDAFAVTETHGQAYITVQKTFGKVTALGGLRGEAVHLDLDRLLVPGDSEQDYTRLYPSLHLSRPLEGGRKLSGSYSRRIQRPFAGDLNPFRAINGATSAFQGNPNLKPQETDSFELGYEKRAGAEMTLATLYYRQTDNAFSVVASNLPGGILLQQRENVGHQSNLGVEVVRNGKLTPKLTYNLSLNLYETRISAPNLGFVTEQSAVTAFGRANLNWQLTPKDFLQFNVFANGKQLIPQGYAEPIVSGNIGYRRTINDKLSLMLVVQDPLGSNKSRLVLDNPTVGLSRLTMKPGGQLAILTLVWNFAGKPRDTGFEFAPGGAGAAAVP